MCDLEQIKKDLDKYGIRNTVTLSKPPLEQPSRMIENGVPGVNLCKDIMETYNHYINVIGVDNKRHLAFPWEDKCKCGTKILSKKFNFEQNSEMFSCYECTY